METIGERIKELRISRRMTQEDLGEILGVKKAAIQKYENGGIVNLKIETIEKIAKIFEITPSYLMGWEKFDNKYDLDKIKLEILVIETIQKYVGDEAVRVIGAMFALNDEAQEKVRQYAFDLCQIDKYVDDQKKETLIEKFPTMNAWR